ncbi:hypothetical protein BO82DRAFT_406612 [Aspergillus uvarum CBS 121591]|uniref:F-box domain-containing protein n=1 Tax=Aspergillus uvarum CBS 121591 TaxID=1448315 RepID=A0A319CEP8_9EURO|nr:hypothetical protein BO82DRAFT_406612 [Aspergillus uvarum CBS 121591]PYH77003.1 hypothetical protein BO82DRAFT_406612 [Aspergillus uvarum CBS 121591]
MNIPSLASVPPEIIHCVLSFTDLSSLSELSLTNRYIGAISQKELLKVVTVYPRKESRERFQAILEDETRARLVDRLYLDVSAWAGYYTQERYINQSIRDKQILQLRRFMKLVPRLKELPRLRSIVLRFHQGCYVEDTWNDAHQNAAFRSCVMSEFILALASLDEPVKELALNYFGFYPKLDLREIHLPRLKTLALGKYAFVHDSQLEWILSHSKTLTELYLDDNPILFEVSVYNNDRACLEPGRYTHKAGLRNKHFATYDKRWHHYFRAFQVRLPHLRHFSYGRSEPWWGEGHDPP